MIIGPCQGGAFREGGGSSCDAPGPSWTCSGGGGCGEGGVEQLPLLEQGVGWAEGIGEVYCFGPLPPSEEMPETARTKCVDVGEMPIKGDRWRFCVDFTLYVARIHSTIRSLAKRDWHTKVL